MKKNIVIVLVCILILILSSLFGCMQDKGISSGYVLTEGRSYVACVCVAYKTESKVIDIDDFKISISFGMIEGTKIANSNCKFELSARNKHNDSLIILEEIDNFVDKGYICTINEKQIEYNHSEEFNIPKDLFADDKGIITISASLISNEEWSEGKTVAFNYKKQKNGKVKISKEY